MKQQIQQFGFYRKLRIEKWKGHATQKNWSSHIANKKNKDEECIMAFKLQRYFVVVYQYVSFVSLSGKQDDIRWNFCSILEQKNR